MWNFCSLNFFEVQKNGDCMWFNLILTGFWNFFFKNCPYFMPAVYFWVSETLIGKWKQSWFSHYFWTQKSSGFPSLSQTNPVLKLMFLLIGTNFQEGSPLSSLLSTFYFKSWCSLITKSCNCLLFTLLVDRICGTSSLASVLALSELLELMSYFSLGP